MGAVQRKTYIPEDMAQDIADWQKYTLDDPYLLDLRFYWI